MWWHLGMQVAVCFSDGFNVNDLAQFLNVPEGDAIKLKLEKWRDVSISRNS